MAEHLEDVVRSWRQHGVGYWAVERDGEFLGVAGLRATTVSGRDCWNLYYRLRPSVWGKGFATEAAREALDVAGKLRPRLPVIARTRPANDAAKKVAARAGMDRHPELDADGFEVFAHGW